MRLSDGGGGNYISFLSEREEVLRRKIECFHYRMEYFHLQNQIFQVPSHSHLALSVKKLRISCQKQVFGPPKPRFWPQNQVFGLQIKSFTIAKFIVQRVMRIRTYCEVKCIQTMPNGFWPILINFTETPSIRTFAQDAVLFQV